MLSYKKCFKTYKYLVQKFTKGNQEVINSVRIYATVLKTFMLLLNKLNM